LTAHPEKQGYCAIGWRTWAKRLGICKEFSEIL
jgi:hypothetical protein